MINPKDCKHPNYDISWSHGECPRCKDCGVIGEFKDFPNIIWGIDPLATAALLNNSGNSESAKRMISYLSLAKKDGFTVYDERLEELTKNPA